MAAEDSDCEECSSTIATSALVPPKDGGILDYLGEEVDASSLAHLVQHLVNVACARLLSDLEMSHLRAAEIIT